MTDGVLNLSDGDIRALADALRTQRLTVPFSSLALKIVLPGSNAVGLPDSLKALSDEGLNERQIAATLELVLRDRQRRMVGSESIELVTTGPDAPGLANRDTAVVVRELFRQAQRSVLVAGYAVHQGRS